MVKYYVKLHNVFLLLIVLANNIAKLPIDFRRPLRFSFLVVPAGKDFFAIVGLPIEDGMCEAPVQLDENYPFSSNLEL